MGGQQSDAANAARWAIDDEKPKARDRGDRAETEEWDNGGGGKV
jgi:hypothetical protein